MDNLQITIPAESSDAHIMITRNGNSNRKNVSLDDLIGALTSGYQISTGILPTGTKLFAGTRSAYKILIEVPGKVREILIGRNESDLRSHVVPFPRTAFVFNVKNNRAVSTHVYALANPISTLQDSLYVFPFGNVYDSNSSVCWGGVSLPEVREPINLSSIINLFFQSNFNGDLITSRTVTFDINRGGNYNGLEFVASQVAFQESFDTSYLTVINNCTLENLFSTH